MMGGRSAAYVAGAAPAFSGQPVRRLLEPARDLGKDGAARKHGGSGAKADLSCAELAPAVVTRVPARKRWPAACSCEPACEAEGTAGVGSVVGIGVRLGLDGPRRGAGVWKKDDRVAVRISLTPRCCHNSADKNLKVKYSNVAQYPV